MQFCSLGSGSQGNSFLVRDDNTYILIDCGFGLAETEKRLERHQVNPNDINAILLRYLMIPTCLLSFYQFVSEFLLYLLVVVH